METQELERLRQELAGREEDVNLLLAERDRLRAEVAQLVAANQALVVEAARMRDAVDPYFILDAMDSVHDMDVTLADYAKAVSRAIRRELEGNA